MADGPDFGELLGRSAEPGWAPLPSWASFWIRVGKRVSNCPKKSERVVLAAAAPTGSHAAALTAAGVVSETLSSGRDIDAKTHFWTVVAPLDDDLPAPVKILTEAGNIVETVLKGIEFDERGGEDRLKARVQWFKHQDKFVYWDESRCLLPIEDADYEERTLLRRHSVDHHPGFVQALPWVESSAHYAFKSQPVCDICGHASHLERSFQETTFTLPVADGEDPSGSLQDIVRVDRWTGKGEGHRARLVLPSDSNRAASFERAQVVIFDGVKSYLKLEQLWPESNQVIVLAHHDRSATQAADRLRRQLVQAKGLVDLVPRGDIPRGVELIAFTEVLDD